MNDQAMRSLLRDVFRAPSRPSVYFSGVAKLISDVFEVRHDIGEPGIEDSVPPSPHPEDAIHLTIDLQGHLPNDGVVLTIGCERKDAADIADQLEGVARKLRGHGRSWKRVGVCRLCGTHSFDADNPPPTGRCPRCESATFDIVDVATELRSAASGCGCGVHDTSNGTAVRA